MAFPSLSEFERMANQGNLIPIYEVSMTSVGSDQTNSLKLARNLKKYAWEKGLEGHFGP